MLARVRSGAEADLEVGEESEYLRDTGVKILRHSSLVLSKTTIGEAKARA